MNPVQRLRLQAGMTQHEFARAASTSQPAIAAYEAERKSPTLRTFERLTRAVGLEIAMSFVVPMTREDRRSLALHEAIARVLRRDPDAVLRKARANIRHMREVNPFAAPLLDEWRRVLRLPVQQVIDVMTDPRPYARDLRQVTPFAGVLSPSERVDAYAALRRTETVA